MSRTGKRPIAVTLVAWLFIAGAITLTLVEIVRHALAMIAGAEPFGLPLLLVLQVGLWFAVLCVPALGLRAGRPWGWFLCALYCPLIVTGLIGEIFALGPMGVPAVLGLPARPLSWFTSFPLAALPMLACAVVYLFLMLGTVLAYCGIRPRARWGLAPAQLAVCALLLGWGGYSAWMSASRERASLLQRIGDAHLGDAKSFRFMLDRLEKGGKEERISAAWALGQSGRADAVVALKEAARSDPDSDVRVNAIAAMAAIEGAGVEETLRPFLRDDDEQVRAAALRGLAEEKYRESAPSVAELLASDSAEIRVLAADALGRMGNEEAVPALIEAAGQTEREVRVHVAFALGRLGDSRATAALIAMADDERWEVRANVAQAIGMIGDDAGRDALRKLLDDPNRQVGYAAQAALDKLEGS